MKKNTPTHKLKQAILLASITGLTASASYAASSPFGNLGSQFSALANQKNLQQEVRSIAIGAVDLFSQANFQKDPNLNTIQAVNTALFTPISSLKEMPPGANQAKTPAPSLTPSQWVANYTNETTLGLISNYLMAGPWALANNSGSSLEVSLTNKQQGDIPEAFEAISPDFGPSSSLPSYVIKKTPYNQYLLQNTESGLLNTVAGDSLSRASNNGPVQVQPGSSQFDFSNLLTPTVYSSSNQLANANTFIKFATMFTVSPAARLNLQNLSSISQLQQAPIYQAFMKTNRNMTAVRSISLSLLNHFVAERAPLPTTQGMSAQLLNALGTKHPSELQIEQYQATHDLHNPNWYKQVNTATQATLLRKILVTLKGIQAQNYQAHLDRERETAAMLANALSVSTLEQKSLQMMISNVNKCIENPGDTKDCQMPDAVPSTS